MGTLKYFCAGASSIEVLPGRNVENILLPTPSVDKDSSSLRQHQQLLQLTRPKHFIIDSGGFQLLVAEANGIDIRHNPNRPLIWNDKALNLAPEHVVKLAATLDRTPDIMIGLDYPIGKVSDPEEQEGEFLRKLGYNSVWARKTCQLKQDSNLHNTRLFIPIQCYTLQQLDVFFSMIEGCQYDGVSMPVRNMTATQLISFLATFYRLGIREIHLLGATSLTNILIAAFFARHYFDWVSIDSQTWRIFGEYSTYLNPYDLDSHHIGQDVRIVGDTETPCICPWCKGRTFPEIKNDEYGDKFWFLTRHNFWVTNNIVEKAYNHAASIHCLNTFLRTNTTYEKYVKLSQTIHGLQLFEIMKEKPIRSLEQALSVLKQ